MFASTNSLNSQRNETEKATGEGLSNSLPFELGVAGLWPPRQEVVSPDIGVDAGIASVVAKHTDTLGLAELASLVVEVLGCGQVLDLCPVLPRAELRSGEDDGMESVVAGVRGGLTDHATKYLRNVVLPHELVERDVLRVLPPLFPV